jgi:hypothetical protein
MEVEDNRLWASALVATSLSVATVLAHGAEARRQSPQAESVTVKISLKAGGQSLTSSGQGSCTHAPRAAIYNVPSAMWTARQQQGEHSVQLTLWRPADGKEEMFSLSLNGPQNINVSTVRGGTISGSGTVKLQPNDKGGTFTINAKAKSGEAITGTIECSAFTAAIAEGG